MKRTSSVAAIKNKPVRNEDPKDAKLREYQAEIERLRALIQRRKAAACEKLPRPRRERPQRGRPAPPGDNCEFPFAFVQHSAHAVQG